MQRFEYRVETIAFKRGKTQPSQADQLATALNEWGQKGWRTITIEFTPHATINVTGACLVLERGHGHWLLNERDE